MKTEPRRDFATLRRVPDERGSHIEPPLEGHWTPLIKLRWLVAVICADRGEVDIRVTLMPVGRLGYFNVTGGGIGTSQMTYDQTWGYLNAIDHGLAIAEHRSRA